MATCGCRAPAVRGGIIAVVVFAAAVMGGASVAAVGQTWQSVPPPPPLDTYEVWMVNRMERDMDFDCDGGRPNLFRLPAHGGDWNISYVTALNRPSFNLFSSSVSCIWSYAGNYMSSVVTWDEKNWPEKKACKTGSGGGCQLLFENKEMVLVATPSGSRRVLGDLPVKECSTHWYGRLLPWGAGCSYPKHDHPYVGTVHSTWSAAAMGEMIGH
uniref:DUF7771 domain-containing protein n=1 Tax=Leersia perrieri TaxID=77586 RepID=A0A0D9X6Y2_9ORYZ